MKTAIEIISEAYGFIGITGVLNGRFSKEGLGFLNDLLYHWNAHNYFPFTQNTVDGHVTGGSGTIAPEQGNTFIGEKPVRVNKVLVRIGNEWYPLKPVAYENIWERRMNASAPYFYAFTNDEQGRGVVVFDCEDGDFDCRVIYNRNLPAMDFNDTLAAPPQYMQVLKYGIAELASVARGMPSEMTAKYKTLKDDALASIKKTNSPKHSIDMSWRGRACADSPADMVMIGRRM